MREQSGRIPEFDVLRAIAILLLLVHHSGIYVIPIFGVATDWLSPFFEAFLLGSFFLMAGFFMEFSLQKARGDTSAFLLSRLPRIHPPYVVALLLYVFVLGITLKSRTDWLIYLAGLHFIFAPEFAKPMLTLWYVGAIFCYYGIFLAIRQLSASVWRMSLLCIVVFVAAHLIHHRTGLFDPRFFRYYFVFLTGMILAGKRDSLGLLSARGILWKGASALAGIWVFSFAAYDESGRASLTHLGASFLFILSVFLLLHSLVARLEIRAPWRWVTYVSYASFFVYLFHRPLWELLDGLIPIQSAQDRILFRLMPASVLVIVICHALQRAYDLLLPAIGRKLARFSARLGIK